MKFTANQIAEILNGEIVGDPEAVVSKLSKIEEGEEGSLTFLSNPKYTNFVHSTKASVCIVNKDFSPKEDSSVTFIKVEDSYEAFSKLLSYYEELTKTKKSGLEDPHFLGDDVELGEDIYIGAFTYLGNNVKIGDKVQIHPNSYIGDNVEIGDHTVIYPGSKIYADCKIGKNCVLHGGVIIGADGFGFTPDDKGVFTKVPQTGNVIIEDHVDVGAGTSIDRATLGSTIIREGVKLDNQIQIAHNVEIGEHTAIAAQTGIAGSTRIGKHCIIGGQVGIVGHIKIGNHVRIQAQTGVGKNVEDGQALQGSPALGYSDFNKSYVHFRNLPKIVNQLNSIEKKISKDE